MTTTDIEGGSREGSTGNSPSSSDVSEVSRRRLLGSLGGVTAAAALAGGGLGAAPAWSQTMLPGIANVFMDAFMTNRDGFADAMKSGVEATIKDALKEIGIDPDFDPDAADDGSPAKPLWKEILDTPTMVWGGMSELWKAMVSQPGSQ
ncbi:MAG: hypothetical protein IT435_02810 [Phycisphaerales bacterium]|nr:hypothetical protein [Phycisphaerales bacterium]